MKILVTGASGGMGGYIIEKLLSLDHKIIATSRSADKLKEMPCFGRIDFVPYNLNDRSEVDLYSFFGKPDAVIHLAWDKLKDHKSDLHVTTILDDNKIFLRNLIQHGLKDLTCVGTCYEYGLKEGELKETDESAPVIAYGMGKDQLRQFLEQLQAEYNFNLKWVRVFNVFSEGKSGGNLYSHLMTAIGNGEEYFNMSGGEQVRDYLTGSEVTEIITKIALQNKVVGIINCCSGKPVKLKDMIQDFLREKNLHIKLNLGYYPYLAHEPMVHWGSREKLDRILKDGQT